MEEFPFTCALLTLNTTVALLWWCSRHPLTSPPNQTAIGYSSAGPSYAIRTSWLGRTLYRGFVCNYDSVQKGYWWTVVSANFLNHRLSNFLFTSVNIFVFGRVMEQLVGHRLLLGIFLMSGSVGNLVHSKNIYTRKDPLHPTPGSKYGLFGMMTTLFLLNYRTEIVLGAVRVPLIGYLATILILEMLTNPRGIPDVFGAIGSSWIYYHFQLAPFLL
eukprot:Filipodium_phascolosomae@DN1837_c0_g1_i1.p1